MAVDFQNNSISSIQIEKQNESVTAADDALNKVPGYIQSAQSVNVDVSSGATVTSKAIMTAVSSAIESAGGNIAEWNTDATGTNTTKEETIETTAVIAGGGISGIAAALRLEQLGIQTTIIEKSGSLGGSLKISDDETQLAVSTSDLTNTDDTVESPADLYKDVYAYGGSQGNEELLHVLFSNLTKTTEWETNDLGLVFEARQQVSGYSGNAIAAYDVSDASPGELLAREADICGADILMNTAVIGLVKDEAGNVTGVRAKASGGTLYTVNADYVILACGSSGKEDDILYYGNDENTADLLKIAEDSSLSTNEGSNVVYHTGIQINDSLAIDTIAGIRSAINEGILLVNQNGERFTNEEGSVYDISTAIANQPSQNAYLIMNVGAYRTFRREILRNTLISDDIEQILEDDESDYNQNFYCKDIRDISKKYEINQQTLLNTILSFNDDTDSGADLLYGRTSFRHKVDVGGELMVVPLCSYKTGDLGGLQIDSGLHVLTEDGTALENVYCIGSAAGGIFGSSVSGGALNTWAFVSAKVCADTIAASANK